MNRILVVFVMLFAIKTTDAQTFDKTMFSDNIEREYVLHIPTLYEDTSSVPLIIALHGLTNNGTILMETSKFDEIADTANFIVAFPTALENGAGLTAWENGLPLLGTGVDDVGFLSALIDTISKDYNVDSSRIYITGYSMGGFMTNRLGCELSDKITAIASHSGTMANFVYNTCSPTKPMPMMHIHGASDNVVNYEGNWLGGVESVDTLMRFWRNHNHCSNTYTVTELDDTENDGIYIDKTVYGPCDDDIELWLYTAYNLGHAWLVDGNDILSSKEIWDFFKQYPKADTTSSPITNINTLVASRIDLKLYPNPASDYLNINLSIDNKEDIHSVQIFSSIGVLMYQNNTLENKINIEAFPVGIYNLRVNQSNYRFLKE